MKLLRLSKFQDKRIECTCVLSLGTMQPHTEGMFVLKRRGVQRGPINIFGAGLKGKAGLPFAIYRESIIWQDC